MWDLPQLVLLRKARHALRAGRLDEAYAIATDSKIGDHRKRQVLLEDLVEPLLERARGHLDAGRAEEAVADVERARTAGGNRPAVVQLRDAALEALRCLRLGRDKERKLMASIEGHIEGGRLAAGEDRLGAAPPEKAEDLRRRLERQKKEAAGAREEARAHLARGDVAAALERARLAFGLARDDRESRDVLLEIGREADAALARALVEGSLSTAETIFGKLSGLEEVLPAAERWGEPLSLCEKAARSIAEKDWGRARVALRRLRGIVPEAKWAERCEEQLRAVEESLNDIEAGPLGRRISVLRAVPAREAGACLTPAGAPTPERTSPQAASREKPNRFFLWVDGVGSYLLLTGDRITIGRPGSSAKPDIALLAELEGVHAEIIRVEQDYFLVPRGKAAVGGRPVRRHLLADGDEFVLGERSRLTFRLPTSLSPTAIIELGQGLRLEGDVRKIILLDGHLIFGPGKGCHIETHRVDGRVILSSGPDGFRCRAPAPLIIQGKTCGMDEPVPPGAHVEAGSLTFTLTAAEREGR